MRNYWHVCIPGWGASVFAWHQFQRALLPLEKTLYIPWQTFCHSAQEIEELLYFLHEREGKIIFYGWSLGALAALETTLRMPEKVAGLFLLSPTPRFLSDDNYDGVNARILDRMIARIQREPEPLLRDFTKNMLYPAGDEEFTKQYIKYAMETGGEALTSGLRYLQTTDLRARLGEITAPTMILHGSEDQIIPMESSVYLADRIKNDSYELCEGEGHHLLLTAHEKIVNAGRAFHNAIEN